MKVTPDHHDKNGIDQPSDAASLSTVLTPGQHHAAHVLTIIAATLPNNGYDDPRRDARHLLAIAMGRDDAVLPHEDITLDDHMITALCDVVTRRKAGEPISRMRGRREFYGLEFMIGPSTLDPRADSEVIVDTVLKYGADYHQPRLVDFGTGSGCLVLASAYHLTTASGIGVDIQADAVAIAAQNSNQLGLDGRVAFKQSSWDDGLSGHFDIIISNPPYIPKRDLDGLMPEVRCYDPVAALDGGVDGMDAWRALAPIFAARLTQDGVAVVEIGIHQENDVTAIMAMHDLKLLESVRDLAGVIRCLVFAHQTRPAS